VKEEMAMSALTSISTHVSLDVADLDGATQFLEETVGVEKLREVTVPGLGRIVFYPGLELMQAGPDATPGLVKHVAWEVEDIRAAMQELKARGVVFESDEPMEAPFEDTGELLLYANFTSPVGLPGELIQVIKL
jgi:catechol 2,3-dioxygenase-like lactoylglutathione lyase family enzyme